MAFSFKKHGITKETIKKMILGAGVIYKNLKYSDGGWAGTVLGATSGGIKFNWEITWLDIEIDGATVLVKGVSKQKVGESASLEGQMTEITEDILVTALHLVKSDDSTVTGYNKYVSKENITEDDDYLENIAYVGTLSNGKNIIIILPNALCTEAFELETKNATQTTYSVKFECTADLENDTLDKLDVEIYFPTDDTTQTAG